MVNYSGLKAILEAQILSWFPVDSDENFTGDPLKSSWMMMCSLGMMWSSIVEDMGCHWMKIMLHLVNDVMVNLCGERLVVCHGRDLTFGL